jgi:hypothetical protein
VRKEGSCAQGWLFWRAARWLGCPGKEEVHPEAKRAGKDLGTSQRLVRDPRASQDGKGWGGVLGDCAVEGSEQI